MLDILHADRFIDKAPQEIYAALLDEKRYLCSVRTMYRILEEEGELKERRNQLSRPHYAKPELLAKAPNEVVAWDITKLKGPVKWTYYYLYVILDIYSRYVVGWMVAHRELAALARKLIEETMQETIDSAGTASDPCGQGIEHDVKTGCLSHGRSRCHQKPFETLGQ